MSLTVASIQAIYDKAYTHPGLMGTHFDQEYSEVTKTRLLRMCREAPNQRLLDVGTGDGDLWSFARREVEAYAFDISYVGSKRAVTRFPHIRAHVAIAEHLPYPAHFFGAALAADTIEHVLDISTTLQELRRVLVPQGTFALSVPTPNSLQKWAINRLLRQVPSPLMFARLLWVVARRTWLFGRATFQPIDRDLSLDEWCRLLKKHHFTVQHVSEWPAPPFKPIVYLIRTSVT